MQNTQVIEAEHRFMQKEEVELISAVKNGDRYAYHDLYEQYCARVYALCFRITGERGLAEDATQEVFIQVWKKIGDFREDSKFSTWLHSVTVNITISFMRKHKTWLARYQSSDESTEPEIPADTDIDSVNLDDLVSRLPERARIVFVLHAIEGFRHEEIADKLNMATGTSKAQYHRAKNLIHEWLM